MKTTDWRTNDTAHKWAQEAKRMDRRLGTQATNENRNVRGGDQSLEKERRLPETKTQKRQARDTHEMRGQGARGLPHRTLGVVVLSPGGGSL